MIKASVGRLPGSYQNDLQIQQISGEHKKAGLGGEEEQVEALANNSGSSNRSMKWILSACRLSFRLRRFTRQAFGLGAEASSLHNALLTRLLTAQDLSDLPTKCRDVQ